MVISTEVKIQVWLRNKKYLATHITTVKPKLRNKHVNEEVKMTMVEFHPQSTQAAMTGG